MKASANKPKTIAAILLFAASGLSVAHEPAPPPLAIRLEHASLCDVCPTYVFGFLADGSSYFLGEANVRALTLRGSYVRKNGFFYQTQALAAPYAKSVTWLSKNRTALSAWLQKARAARIFSDSSRATSCTPLHGHIGEVTLTVDLDGMRATSRACYDPQNPDAIGKLISALHAIYEYPDDFAIAPPFASPYVLRFGHIWEKGGRDATCTSQSPEDYVLYVSRDRKALIFGRQAIYGNKEVPLAAISATTHSNEDAFERLWMKILELKDLKPETVQEPQVVMAGAAELPKLTLTLHVKDPATGQIHDLTPLLNPHLPQKARGVINALSDLAQPLVGNLPKPDGLRAYCRSRPPRV